jgi:hypothetical protein
MDMCKCGKTRYDCINDGAPCNAASVSNSRLIDGLCAELYDALDEWFKSLDLLMILNGCCLAELIGKEDKDLRRIYKAYQAIKATGI